MEPSIRTSAKTQFYSVSPVFLPFYLYSERDFLIMVLLLVVLNLIHLVSQSFKFKLLLFLKNELFHIFGFKLCQCKF